MKCDKPVEVYIDKIVPTVCEVPKFESIQVEKIVIHENKIPVNCIVEKTVPVRTEVPVPQPYPVHV